jgi:hypothetical protein
VFDTTLGFLLRCFTIPRSEKKLSVPLWQFFWGKKSNWCIYTSKRISVRKNLCCNLSLRKQDTRACFSQSSTVNSTQLRWCGGKPNDISCCFFDLVRADLNYLFLKGFRELTDGTFPTAKELVPKCLDHVSTNNIHCYFCHCWQYMDAYQWVLILRLHGCQTYL